MNETADVYAIKKHTHTIKQIGHAEEQKKQEIRKGQVAEVVVCWRMHIFVATHDEDHDRIRDQTKNCEYRVSQRQREEKSSRMWK